MVNDKQIFIVGAQRSGTTLLRLILNAHSKISIPEDATFLMPVLKNKYLHQAISGDQLKAFVQYLSVNSWFKLWNYDRNTFISQISQVNSIKLRDLLDKLYYSYCLYEGKEIWGDKTPSFFRKIDILHSLFPDAKFVHIVRDGRDVFDSWRRMNPEKNNVAVTAMDWCIKLYKIEKSFCKIPLENRITIRYEDLIDNSEMTMKEICSILELEYEDEMLQFYKNADRYIGSHHSRFIFGPLNKSNKNKWKKNLSIKEIKLFEIIAKHYLVKNQYEIGADAVKPAEVIEIIKLLIVGLPKKIALIFHMKNTLQKAAAKGEDINSLPTGDVPDKK